MGSNPTLGTHALKAGSGTKLWTRLSQHKGQLATGGGNHRGSIFRLLIGTALIARHGRDFPTWDVGNTVSGEMRHGELALEQDVSRTIGNMPFLWLAVEDEAGPESLRGYVERNSIALLTNFQKPALDAASENWLGRRCDRERVRSSGLWNYRHVNESYDPAFLDRLDQLVSATGYAS